MLYNSKVLTNETTGRRGMNKQQKIIIEITVQFKVASLKLKKTPIFLLIISYLNIHISHLRACLSLLSFMEGQTYH